MTNSSWPRVAVVSRQQIAARNDNLDIAWLKDTSNDPEDDLREPDELAAAIVDHIKNALEETETASDESRISDASQYWPTVRFGEVFDIKGGSQPPKVRVRS
jgi:hypothetical protein